MFLIDTIWEGKILLSYYFFLWVLPTIAVVSEVLQVFGWLPGVFDILDLVCYVGAVVVLFNTQVLLKIIAYESSDFIILLRVSFVHVARGWVF